MRISRGKAYRAPMRLRPAMSKPTAATRTAPLMMYWVALSTERSDMPLSRLAMTSAPRTAPDALLSQPRDLGVDLLASRQRRGRGSAHRAATSRGRLSAGCRFRGPAYRDLFSADEEAAGRTTAMRWWPGAEKAGDAEDLAAAE